MQRPSLQNVRIRSTRDALHVFYAVARTVIPLITRRLDAEERRAIVPGNVYVWEERSANGEATGLGMERWTDGMGWGPSRVRDQTYSVRVSLPEDRPRGIFRKWHLTAYFSQQKLDRLNTVDNIQEIGDIPVPDGWFRSARRDGKSRREDDLPKSVVAKRLSQTPMEGVMPTSEPVQSSSYQSHVPAPIYTQFPTSANASQSELSETLGARKTSYSLPSSAEHPHHGSIGVRQTTYSAPNLVPGREHTRYRESFAGQSFAGQSSSNCPSPLSSSSSMPATPSPRINPTHLSDQLVPLEYLQNLSYPRRDPIDEQFLRRFSTQTLTWSAPKFVLFWFRTGLRLACPGRNLVDGPGGAMKHWPSSIRERHVEHANADIKAQDDFYAIETPFLTAGMISPGDLGIFAGPPGDVEIPTP
ncbi:hypothetical protein BS17DRAFT_815240 [Gyrodon lividus]|nr:hypothetical protein BS17DRAFT_815240 [Gyrodon lividus]